MGDAFAARLLRVVPDLAYVGPDAAGIVTAIAPFEPGDGTRASCAVSAAIAAVRRWSAHGHATDPRIAKWSGLATVTYEELVAFIEASDRRGAIVTLSHRTTASTRTRCRGSARWNASRRRRSASRRDPGLALVFVLETTSSRRSVVATTVARASASVSALLLPGGDGAEPSRPSVSVQRIDSLTPQWSIA